MDGGDQSSGAKRPLEDVQAAGTKRSRFDLSAAPTQHAAAAPPLSSGIAADAIARAAALAAAISKNVQAPNAGLGRVALSTGVSQSVAASAPAAVPAAGGAGAMQAAPKPSAAVPRVRLDAQGRLVDEQGNVVEPEKRQVSTLRVNDPNRQITADQIVTRAERPSAVATAERAAMGPGGKINPYLAHRVVAAQAQAERKEAAASDTAAAGPKDATSAAILEAAEAEARRRRRADRALHFVQEGAYAAAGDKMREEEAKRAEMLALRQRGGRNRPKFHREEEQGAAAASAGTAGSSGQAVPAAASSSTAAEEAGAAQATPAVASGPSASALSGLPAKPSRGQTVPDVEWWDAPFLPPARAKAYAMAHSVAGKKATALAAAAQGAKPAATGDAAASGDVPMEQPAAADAAPAVVTAKASAVPSAPAFSYSEMSIEGCKTLALVQHPVPITPLADPDAATGGAAPTTLTLILTKEERRKIRRQTRAEKHKFILDQQKLGLLPPPEPKVRLANMMRVLKDAAVADPSAVEAKVRQQAAARMQAHERHNQARALKPEHKLDKWRRKMGKHGPAGPDAVVFRVVDLSHGRVRYKVDVGAREHFLGGIALVAKAGGVSMVYVEGGTKAVNRYCKIMAKIDWKNAAREQAAKAARAARSKGDDEDDDEDDEDEESESEGEEDDDDEDDAAGGKRDNGYGPGALCELVWRGIAPRKYFSESFSFEECRTSGTARRLMEQRGLTHLWDIVSHSEHARRVANGEERDLIAGDDAEGGLLSSTGLLTGAMLQSGMAGAGFASSAGAAAGAGSSAGGQAQEDEDMSDSEDDEAEAAS